MLDENQKQLLKDIKASNFTFEELSKIASSSDDRDIIYAALGRLHPVMAAKLFVETQNQKLREILLKMRDDGYFSFYRIVEVAPYKRPVFDGHEYLYSKTLTTRSYYHKAEPEDFLDIRKIAEYVKEYGCQVMSFYDTDIDIFPLINHYKVLFDIACNCDYFDIITTALDKMLKIALGGAVVSEQEKTVLSGLDLKSFVAEIKDFRGEIDTLFRKHLRVPELKGKLEEVLSTSGKGLGAKAIALEKIDRASENIILRTSNKVKHDNQSERSTNPVIPHRYAGHTRGFLDMEKFLTASKEMRIKLCERFTDLFVKAYFIEYSPGFSTRFPDSVLSYLIEERTRTGFTDVDIMLYAVDNFADPKACPVKSDKDYIRLINAYKANGVYKDDARKLFKRLVSQSSLLELSQSENATIRDVAVELIHDEDLIFDFIKKDPKTTEAKRLIVKIKNQHYLMELAKSEDEIVKVSSLEEIEDEGFIFSVIKSDVKIAKELVHKIKNQKFLIELAEFGDESLRSKALIWINDENYFTSLIKKDPTRTLDFILKLSDQSLLRSLFFDDNFMVYAANNEELIKKIISKISEEAFLKELAEFDNKYIRLYATVKITDSEYLLSAITKTDYITAIKLLDEYQLLALIKKHPDKIIIEAARDELVSNKRFINTENLEIIMIFAKYSSYVELALQAMARIEEFDYEPVALSDCNLAIRKKATAKLSTPAMMRVIEHGDAEISAYASYCLNKRQQRQAEAAEKKRIRQETSVKENAVK